MIAREDPEIERMMKLFIALEVPEDVRRQIFVWQQMLARDARGFRWDLPENFHVTLKFLGQTPEGRLGDIVGIMDDIAATTRSYLLELRGVGAFPSTFRPRVLWAGLGEGADETARIASSLDWRLGTLGIPRESRPYKGHVTVGRSKNSEFGRTKIMLPQSPVDCAIGRWLVQKMVLMQSEPRDAGSKYSVLHSSDLATFES